MEKSYMNIHKMRARKRWCVSNNCEAKKGEQGKDNRILLQRIFNI